uniref:Immunoglobulin subtype domain-containing protein n=1 Tax=Neogobius melanostomus TaxID=47308 RepID=A0A8C6UJI6_9GOBI
MRLQTFAVRLFLCFIGTSGSRFQVSGSSSQTRFIQTNKDLQLTVTEGVQLGEGATFYWKFKNINIVRLITDIFIYNSYKGRVEFFPQNLSLTLQNVQLSDSGIYMAVVSGEQDVTHATYTVRVEAPVSPVLLSVDSVFNSPESCNFTVSCTTELSPSISRSFTCDRHTCEEAHPPTPGPAPSDLTSFVLTSSLQLSLTNERITCNHSNQVSWTQDTKNWREICPISGKEGKVEPFLLLLLDSSCKK